MAKLKVTLSLDRSLLGAVDAAVKDEAAGSRSAAVEEALRLWQLEHKRHRLEREVEVYYRSLTSRERREDRAWAQMSGRHVKRLWEE